MSSGLWPGITGWIRRNWKIDHFEEGDAMRKRRGKHQGFMLLELIIVVAIIGILAAVAVPNLTGMTDDAKIARIQSDLSAMGTAAEVYYVKNGSYPTSLDQLVGTSEKSGYLKKVPEPPDESVTYTISNGTITANFKGVTYSSDGTNTKSST